MNQQYNIQDYVKGQQTIKVVEFILSLPPRLQFTRRFLRKELSLDASSVNQIVIKLKNVNIIKQVGSFTTAHKFQANPQCDWKKPIYEVEHECFTCQGSGVIYRKE